MANGFKKPRRARKSVLKSRVKRPAVKGAFKKKVLSVLKSQAETKQAWLSLSSTDINQSINNVSDTYRIVPNITNGTADNQRIGDKINLQSLNLRAIFQMLPQGTNQSDAVRKLAIRVMIVTPKSYPNWTSGSTNSGIWQAGLLKKGGTTVGFTGVVDDLYAPINSDAITCHYNKVFFCNQGSFYYPGAAPYTISPVPFEQNNMVKFVNKTFSFKNKVLKYDTAIDSGLTPTNMGHFLVVGYVFTDGTAPDSATRCRIQFTTTINYEDC